MKQFIVLCAVLPLLLIIMIQFTLDQITAHKISMVNELVYSAREEAKQEGCFTDSIKEKLHNDLLDLGFDEENITLNLDSNFHERGSLIEYEVKVKLEHAMVKAMVNDDSYCYTIKSYTASEALGEL